MGYFRTPLRVGGCVFLAVMIASLTVEGSAREFARRDDSWANWFFVSVHTEAEAIARDLSETFLTEKEEPKETRGSVNDSKCTGYTWCALGPGADLSVSGD